MCTPSSPGCSLREIPWEFYGGLLAPGPPRGPPCAKVPFPIFKWGPCASGTLVNCSSAPEASEPNRYIESHHHHVGREKSEESHLQGNNRPDNTNGFLSLLLFPSPPQFPPPLQIISYFLSQIVRVATKGVLKFSGEVVCTKKRNSA